MKIKNKKILITGGCGFIGSHLLDELVKRGNEITVLDNLSTGTLSNTEQSRGKFKFIKGDIRNFSLLKKLTKDKDIIFHFAAQPDVRKSFYRVFEDFEVNVLSTIYVLEAMKKNNVPVIVFASSAGTIYGENAPLPTKEDYKFQPISHYGASKAACEMYLSSYSSLLALKAVSIRYGNIFGPRSNHGVVYDFFWKLKKNPKELEILGDGKQEKSYLFISDCITATLLAVEKTEKGFSAFNISSPYTIKVLDIAKEVIESMNLKDVKIKFTGGKRGWPGDVTRCFADISKIKKIGFVPKVKMDEAIKKYVEYLKCVS